MTLLRETADLPFPALAGVPSADTPLNRKDFKSDQEVRWCPGCGDYAILAAVQGFLPELGFRRENIVFVSGIGCSSRFPYYMNTYGMHSIHGRAPAIATGMQERAARPARSGWSPATAMRSRSAATTSCTCCGATSNMKILLFNNRIYGLTKGQYSPTSELGKETKSSPMGSVDDPFNPISLALGAEATFVARTVDSDRKHLTGVLSAAAAHQGTSLVEIYQNCNIFNDGAFDAIKNPDSRADAIIPLVHGEPIRFGADTEGNPTQGVVRDRATGGVRVAALADVPAEEILVHDAHAEDPTTAFAISRLTGGGVLHRAPIGIFRQVAAATYDDRVRDQVRTARHGTTDPEAALAALLAGGDTWTVV